MRRIVYSLLILIFCFSAACAFAGCSQPENNMLVIGYFADNSPLSFKNSDGYTEGFDLSLAAAVLERLDIEYSFVEIKRSTAEKLLFLGEIDLIWGGLGESGELLERFVFSHKYIRNVYMPVVRADSGILSAADIPPYDILALESAAPSFKGAAESGLFSGRFINNGTEFVPNSTVRLSSSAAVMAEDLKQGICRAAIMGSVNFNYLSRLAKYAGLFKMFDYQVASEEYGIAARKADVELIDKINNVLLALQADGSLGALASKWNLQNQLVPITAE